MNRFTVLALIFVASSAVAEGPGAGPMPPKVTKKDKKGIEALYKAANEAFKQGNVEAFADLVDFPAMMVTDGPGGATGESVDRAKWVALMKPAMEATPKEAKVTMKNTVELLSDSLAVSTDSHTMAMGTKKLTWKSASLLVLKNGKWLFKAMSEGGWGSGAGPEAKKEVATANAQASTPAPAAKPPASPPSAAAVALFGKKCGSCHGKDGKAATDMGTELKVGDLTKADVQAKFTDDQAVKVIAEGAKEKGSGKEVMPGFKGKLSDDEIKELVKVVRSFQSN